MKPVTTIFLLLFTLNVAVAQVATIKDKDGYTNVRSEPRADASVIYKVRDAELFYFDVEADQKTEWVQVFVPRNKFSVACSEPDYITGYIHSSRLLPLENLEKYVGTDFAFRYQTVPFSTENKLIEYHDKAVIRVNGRRMFGTDGGFPRNEVASIDVVVSGKKVNVPKVLFEDLFECDNNITFYKHKDVYYASQWNSDGAGAYMITWVIDAEGVRQRLILIL